eukprot:360019-Chlamydomonas_euryale.AAC.15
MSDRIASLQGNVHAVELQTRSAEIAKASLGGGRNPAYVGAQIGCCASMHTYMCYRQPKN